MYFFKLMNTPILLSWKTGKSHKMGQFSPKLGRHFAIITSTLRFCCSSTDKPVRVRFAPSPTGELHLGSLRTAFFNFLWARKYNGAFVLRIEDTDRDRIVNGSEEKFEQTLTHFGLCPDESPLRGGHFGPYRQSECLPAYHEAAEQLLSSGHAYKCFCSMERIEILRRKAHSERTMFRYDGTCRHLSPEEVRARVRDGEKYTVHFKYEHGQEGFMDIVYGDYMGGADEGDFVIIKQDGYPTYHFANVVDDNRMKISYVIRGSEWLVSTPKHLRLYRAFGWTPPAFAHLPLITMDGHRKLSKRFQAGYVGFYLQKGYLPIAVLNFLVRNGSGISGHATGQLYSLEELIARFDEHLISRGSFMMNMSELDNYGKLAFKQATIQELLSMTKGLFERLPEMERDSIDQTLINGNYMRRVLSFLKLNEEAFSHLGALTSGQFRFFFGRPRNAQKLLEHMNEQHSANECAQMADSLERWLRTASEQQLAAAMEGIKAVSAEFGVPYPTFAKLFRQSMIDNVEGPPVQELVDFFGQEECCKRLASMSQMLLDQERRDQAQTTTT